MPAIAKDGHAAPPLAAFHEEKKVRKRARFWDRIAAKYSRQPVADEEAYQHKLAVTREYFDPEMSVLEFGCGTGTTAISHAPYVKHIRATDISENMIDIARDKAHAAGVKNVTFECVGVEEISVVDESYDVIMGHSILHLVEDREAVIAQVRRWLKPGGVFVSSTACLGDKMAWFRLIAPIGRVLGFFPLVRVFKGEELVRAMRDAGFQIEYEWRPEKAIALFIVARKTQ